MKRRVFNLCFRVTGRRAKHSDFINDDFFRLIGGSNTRAAIARLHGIHRILTCFTLLRIKLKKSVSDQPKADRTSTALIQDTLTGFALLLHWQVCYFSTHVWMMVRIRLIWKLEWFGLLTHTQSRYFCFVLTSICVSVSVGFIIQMH